MQDKIEREIIIKAPKKQVYEAIADPSKIISWFPDEIEGTLNEGDQPVLNFGGHGKTEILVVSTKPNYYFAYRWVPGASHFVGNVKDAKTTLVEFKLTEANGATTLKMVESGFSELPAEVAESSFNQNSGGWSHMLGRP
jgi:uncharacterized protein YndB with AHSA1/START domain